MKILIAEDDAVSRLVLTATLKKAGHEVIAATNGEEAWQAWQQDHFPVIISDWNMPDVDGLELCRRIRSSHEARAARYTYIILLTARGGKTSYLDAMDAGADDFVTKPFDEDELNARLCVAARILDLHATLRSLALHDTLTGLWNRAAILNNLLAEMERAAREGSSLAVLLTDLDRFKSINDTHGHGAGDAVLVEAGRRMRKALRTYDKIGRYGGEEFLMILPHCGKEEVAIVGERIRQLLSGTPIDAGPELTVTVSIGAAVVNADWKEQQIDSETLIRRADEALYRAKANGRDRVEIHS